MSENSIPKLIFIIPYRDRKEHLDHFTAQRKIVMEDYQQNEYKFI